MLLAQSETPEDRLLAIRSVASTTPGNQSIDHIVLEALRATDSKVRFEAARWSLNHGVNLRRARELLYDEVKVANPYAMYFAWKFKSDRSFLMGAFQSLDYHHDAGIRELVQTALNGISK